VADVDAELERSGRDQHFQRAFTQARLGVEAFFFRQTAVVGSDVLGAEKLGQLVRHALGEPARVHHDERGPVGLDELDQAPVDLLPDFGRHHRFEGRAGDFHREIDSALVAAIDDCARRRGIGADQEARDFLDRLLCGRQPDALELARPNALDRVERVGGARPDVLGGVERVGVARLNVLGRVERAGVAPAHVFEPLERERQVRAAARFEHRVDFVDDHHPSSPQHLARLFRRQQEVERFRRGHENVRRGAQHRRALGLRRVAAAHRGGDTHRPIPHVLAEGADFPARLREVLVDVGGQRFQRRHVDHADFIGQRPALEAFAEKLVDRGQEGREGLSRPGRRRDQGVLAAPYRTPAFELGIGRRQHLARAVRGVDRKAVLPPALKHGMKVGGQQGDLGWGGESEPWAARGILPSSRAAKDSLIDAALKAKFNPCWSAPPHSTGGAATTSKWIPAYARMTCRVVIPHWAKRTRTCRLVIGHRAKRARTCRLVIGHRAKRARTCRFVIRHSGERQNPSSANIRV
jgi:hypothetical protein